MILEVAAFTIAPSAESAVRERIHRGAQACISAMPGFVVAPAAAMRSRSTGRYLLLVQWLTVEHHMVGFRGSPQFQQWRALLGRFLRRTPAVEHLPVP